MSRRLLGLAMAGKGAFVFTWGGDGLAEENPGSGEELGTLRHPMPPAGRDPTMATRGGAMAPRPGTSCRGRAGVERGETAAQRMELA